MILKNKIVTVIGMGRSGISAARFLSRRGARVTIVDSRPKSELKEALASLPGSVTKRFETNALDENSQLIVLSPGVDIASPTLDKARKKKVEIIGELELASRFIRTPLIAVTGTNGKSTTVTLIQAMLAKAGKDAAVAGNIGTPLIELAANPPKDFIVVEVSSFQLETTDTFHPHIAVVLNLTPDHMNRHHTMKHYGELKARIGLNQTTADHLILNRDDPQVARMGTGSKARQHRFSLAREVGSGACLLDGMVLLNQAQLGLELMEPESMSIAARTQMENVLAAITAAHLAGVRPGTMRSVLSRFKGLEHRLEFVRTVRGVDFINDSKGTNIGAVKNSLSRLNRPVILIIGGQDKGSRFGSLKKLFKEKVKHMILIGEARPRIQKVLNGSFGYESAESMQDAVRQAYKHARKGDVVLLSPACASFDMFRDYADRGRQFKKAVRKL